MAGKAIQCVISQDLVASRPDHLASDCLRVETTSKIILNPNTASRTNLCIHNTASEGRMAQIVANFDPRQLSVVVPTSSIYVAPGGKTVVYAIITPIISAGHGTITFDVI